MRNLNLISKLRQILFIGLIISICIHSSVSNEPAEQEWVSLFNGKDLTGWTVKCKEKDRSKHFWQVDNKTILANSLDAKGHDYVWLMTEHEYQDFELRLKFQAFKNSPGNSGVQIRSRYDENEGWLNGPQIDINPPGPWRTGMMWDETRGNQRWIFPNLPKGKWVNESMANPELKFYYSEDKPAWNTLEIKVIGWKVHAKLNGIKVTNFNGKGILDDKTHHQRNVGQKGYIALQIHKGDQLKIRFKDIKIKELKAVDN